MSFFQWGSGMFYTTLESDETDRSAKSKQIKQDFMYFSAYKNILEHIIRIKCTLLANTCKDALEQIILRLQLSQLDLFKSVSYILSNGAPSSLYSPICFFALLVHDYKAL